MTRHCLPTRLDEIFGNLACSQESQCYSGVSLYETAETFVVEAAVPGFKADEIAITAEKGWIQIEAKKGAEKKDVKVHLQASSCYSYAVPVPEGIDESATPEATAQDGILKITFAKAKVAKSVKITVKSV